MTLQPTFVASLILLSSATLVAQQPSADWSQWRGPKRDGSVPSFVAPRAWPDQLTRRWKVEAGLGYATPLVIGNRVFTFTRVADDEVVRALDAATGNQIWMTKYSALYDLIRAADVHGKGPKATPAFADGRLFTLGISGILSAFDAGSSDETYFQFSNMVTMGISGNRFFVKDVSTVTLWTVD